MILDIGEKVYIIERRYFPEDLRRHFIGEVIRCTEGRIRIKGHAWVFDSLKGQFTQRPEEREIVVHLGERITINVIPSQVNLSEVKYAATQKGQSITDGKKLSLDISEFMGVR